MFLAPKFFGGSPPNFWSGSIKYGQIPTMWQSFKAIGQPQPQTQVSGHRQEFDRGSGAAGSNAGNVVRSDNSHKNSDKFPSTTRPAVKNNFGRKCHICNSPHHLKAACDKRTGSSMRVNSTTLDRVPRSPDNQTDTQATVNRVTVEGMSTLDSTVASQTDYRPTMKSAVIFAEFTFLTILYSS